MAASAGYPGELKVGANVVAEIKKADLGIDVDMYDVTKMTGFGGSNARTYIPGLAKASLKLDASLDMTDTDGQLAFFNGISTGTLFTLSVLTGVSSTSAYGLDGYVKNFNPKLDVAAENTVSIEFQPTGAVSYTP